MGGFDFEKLQMILFDKLPEQIEDAIFQSDWAMSQIRLSFGQDC
jgi:hypothetical protein